MSRAVVEEGRLLDMFLHVGSSVRHVGAVSYILLRHPNK